MRKVSSRFSDTIHCDVAHYGVADSEVDFLIIARKAFTRSDDLGPNPVIFAPLVENQAIPFWEAKNAEGAG
jgi:hypothetical protein